MEKVDWYGAFPYINQDGEIIEIYYTQGEQWEKEKIIVNSQFVANYDDIETLKEKFGLELDLYTIEQMADYEECENEH